MNMLSKPKFFLTAVLLTLTSAVTAEDSLTPQQQQSDFIDEMVHQHGFDKTFLNKVLAGAEVKNSILEAIARPAEKTLTWSEYRKIFLIPKRIEGGVKFWRENRAALDAAYERYGVPPEIITAILGVETLYGKNTGGYRVLDSLSTLGFHYPPRAKFFRSELSHFLLLAREEEMDPAEPTGSYAGAMGKPQFIPSSYRHYAIDFDHDGKRDIWQNNSDIIGSVANYFSRHGWRRNQPVTAQLSGVTKDHKAFIEAGMKPSLSVARLVKAGIKLNDSSITPAMSTSLVELIVDDGHEHWAGLHNFYVITRYNHSNMYAMAVYQLSQEIKKAYNSSKT